MSIADREECLFKEWEAGKTNFVRDGVVCEEAYLNSEPKVAFILMEYAHKHEKSEKFDLRENELKEPYGQGWYKAARILHGINMLNKLPKQRTPYQAGMPENICAFNLDKSGGHQKNDPVRLTLAAMKDKDYIRRQFDIYEPDLTLCCGTFEIVHTVLDHERFEVRKVKGVPWYKTDNAQYVLGINHTADRGRQKPAEVIAAVKAIYFVKK